MGLSHARAAFKLCPPITTVGRRLIWPTATKRSSILAKGPNLSHPSGPASFKKSPTKISRKKRFRILSKGNPQDALAGPAKTQIQSGFGHAQT
jgi:hypothetical protein